MKTLFICDSATRENHVGEDYDDIMEVDRTPTKETLQEWGYRIKDHIRKNWEQDKSDNRKVEIYLDAASPYNAILIDLQIIMKKEEDIKVELPYLEK